MTHPEIQAALAELLSITVGRQIGFKEAVTRDLETSWDSLKHVELIFMLEERFGVQFSEQEMAELRSSDRIVQAIEEKHAA
ncbi:MAG: acyl carrier protein [Terriglobales bacterium]